ncbi:hypothetical protein D9611_006553 [Ephemerocybe angulata]|uniref:Aminoglycoside phosphotransferase domain-containing protein n=1 Tax=Ephemerocybe angulata TaxID=980116 RepID=A0A8H5C751_9AGAR|nr:hypothetical protein D9611_006553 [Tulosesus angulatus]
MLRSRFLSTMATFEDYFRYTSGRWIHDEQRYQRMRYQRFNVDALKHLAMKSVKANGVDAMSKLGEGRCNNVFHVKLDNGHQVIARIPTPISGPKHLVTASEVATMRFLRERLGLTQVPRILSSSSRAAETAVGAEFIIMDVADGIELDTVWQKMSMNQKIDLVLQWVRFEAKVTGAFSGGGYGSLYYRKDVPAHLARDVFLNDGKKDDEFVLGPSTRPHAYGFWEDQYGHPADIVLDRGPWGDAPTPTKFTAPWDPPAHLRIPEDHIALLDTYDKVAKYFIPDADERYIRPCMTLLDSNPCNIFLSREAFERDGTVEISAVIDWQHTAVLPLYVTALFPRFITDAERPPVQELEALEKEQAYLRKAYYEFYHDANIDRVWASALSFPDKWTMDQLLPIAAQQCWHGGYPRLKRELIYAVKEWKTVADTAEECPISFSEQDSMAQAKDDVEASVAAEEILEGLEMRIGVQRDGWVANKDFERASQTNRRLREVWRATVKGDELFRGTEIEDVWPFGNK